VKAVRLPPRSPNLNSHLERFFGSLKSECLDKMIFFGERSLRNAVGEFVEHYHRERNHQRLANAIIDPGIEAGRDSLPRAARRHFEVLSSSSSVAGDIDCIG